MVLEYLQIQNKACASLCFSGSPPRIGYLSLWIHEACLRHDLSPHVESARLVTWIRDWQSNSPPPMSSDQMLAPGKTKLIKFPPFRAGKDIKYPGYAGGGGSGGVLKLQFDWYLKHDNNFTESILKYGTDKLCCVNNFFSSEPEFYLSSNLLDTCR